MATQQENISLGYGIRRTPSMGEGGELSEAINLTPKNGELVNIQPPVDLDVSLTVYETLMAVHETSLYKHYIVQMDYSASGTSGGQHPAPAQTAVDVYVYNLEYGVRVYSTFTQSGATMTLTLTLTDSTTVTRTIQLDTASTLLIDLDGYDYSNSNIVGSVTCDSATTEFSGGGVYITVDPEDPDLQLLYNYGIWYFTEDDTTRVCLFETNNMVNSIVVMGNTLVSLSDGAKRYNVWRDGAYLDLGESLPDFEMELGLRCNLSFAYETLKLSVIESDNVAYDYDTWNQTINESDVDATPNRYSYDTGTYNHYFYYQHYYELDTQLSAGQHLRIYNRSIYDIVMHFITPGDNGENATTCKAKSGGYVDVTIKANSTHVYISTGAKYHSGTYTLLLVFMEGTNNGSAYALDNSSADNLNALMGAANKFLSDKMDDEHKFVLPFYARVGLRLYDGTITRLSTPILMTPNSSVAPYEVIAGVTGAATKYEYPITLFAQTADLMHRVVQGSMITELEDWEDIITGVVIAVTPPIYEYKQSYEYDENEVGATLTHVETRLVTDGNGTILFEGIDGMDAEAFTISTDESGDELYYKRYLSEVAYDTEIFPAISVSELGEGETSKSVPYEVVNLPSYTDDEIKQHYEEFDSFFVLAELSIDDLSTDFTDLDLSTKRLLSAVATWEAVPDDQNSHDSIAAKIGYGYNSRLHLAGITQTYWGVSSPFLMAAYYEGNPDALSTAPQVLRTLVTIVENGVTIVADSGFVLPQRADCPLYWFYYPNRNAKSAVIYLREGTASEGISYNKAKIDLTRHEYLNGAYWFDNYNEIPFEETTESEATASYGDSSVFWSNKLYVSNVNDPFTFPTTGKIEVGDGEIRAISTAARAMSEGQFGEFPLYVFCSDGIWSLFVSSDGTYQAAKPVSRDVISNEGSNYAVTQVDDAVVYVTNQGLKIISGSEPRDLSRKISGYNISESYFSTAIDDLTDITYVEDTSQFVELLQSAYITYDYPHKMLHIFLDTSKYFHYTYDFESDEFSKQLLDDTLMQYKTAVPGYPYTTIQFTETIDGTAYYRLYQYQQFSDDDTRRVGIIVTRSYSFGNPLSKKALYDLRIVGQRISIGTKYKVRVYISDNNVTWHELSSLKMKSAKFYRFVIVTEMYDLESLSGISCQIQERYTRKFKTSQDDKDSNS